ncbi:MAG: cob(I)yrinic acid a,c-diamide adenosyltransferase [Chloroflexi bacterium]|nr:MAG: cob(I)yrinic acid a,c-diamide adenosyltransferase [Chloroflexota bacterium]
MKIYTRSGDYGETGLFGGQRVSKADLRVEAYGSVDELNATLGFARSFISDPEIDVWLAQAQSRLFDLGADLATPQAGTSQRTESHVQRVQNTWVKELEDAIDEVENELTPLSTFILPGGTPGAAALHLARTVCRRAERRVVALSQQQEINPAILVYLNRLSDLLFVLARLANQRAGEQDTPWTGTVRAGEAGN